MLEWLSPFLAEPFGTFVATLLGVLVAFGLDRLVDIGRDRSRQKRQKAELRDLEGLLADSLSYNLNVLYAIVQGVAGGDSAGRSAVASFRFAVWEANAARFMAICPDAQEKTDFAVFFEELTRIRTMRALEPPYSVGGSPGTASVYLTAIEDAINIGTARLQQHGSTVQAKAAMESRGPVLQDLQKKRAAMLPWENKAHTPQRDSP